MLILTGRTPIHSGTVACGSGAVDVDPVAGWQGSLRIRAAIGAGGSTVARLTPDLDGWIDDDGGRGCR